MMNNTGKQATCKFELELSFKFNFNHAYEIHHGTLCIPQVSHTYR